MTSLCASRIRSASHFLTLICAAFLKTNALLAAGLDVPEQSGDILFYTVVPKDGLKEIALAGFAGNSPSVTFPETITGLPVKGFHSDFRKEHPSVTNLTIPSSLTNAVTWSSGAAALGPKNYPALKRIEVAAGNPTYKSVDGVLYSADGASLIQYPSGRGETYTIPNGVKAIGMNAFRGNPNITKVIIPDSVTKIDAWAFYDCKSLTSVFFKGNAPTSLGTIPATPYAGERNSNENVFGKNAPEMVIYFTPSANGFTTPKWQGYPTKTDEQAAKTEPAGPLAWISNDGKTIRADFVKLDGETVVVRMENGKEYQIPLARLSPDSVAQARKSGGAN